MKKPKSLVYFYLKRFLFAFAGTVSLILNRIYTGLTRSRPSKGWISVLMYHYIKPRDVSLFRRHIDIIKRSNPVKSLHSLTDTGFSGNGVLVTLDDGFKSILETVIPYLKDAGVFAVVFIPAGYIGKRPDWIGNRFYRFEDEMVMNPDQIREAAQWCEIGSHGFSHKNFVEMSVEQRRRELEESKKILEDICGKEVNSISFPFGGCDDDLIELAKETGYRYLFSTMPAVIQTGVVIPVLGRFEAYPFDTVYEIMLKVEGVYEWHSAAIRLKARMANLFNHQHRNG